MWLHGLAEWPDYREYPLCKKAGKIYTSAASGVAYAESGGATNLLNWTDAGPKTVLISLRQRRLSAEPRISCE